MSIILGDALSFRLRSALSGQRKRVDIVEPSQTAVSLLSRHSIQLHQILHVRKESPDQLPSLFRVLLPQRFMCLRDELTDVIHQKSIHRRRSLRRRPADGRGVRGLEGDDGQLGIILVAAVHRELNIHDEDFASKDERDLAIGPRLLERLHPRHLPTLF